MGLIETEITAAKHFDEKLMVIGQNIPDINLL